jgi:hypothetical protein
MLQSGSKKREEEDIPVTMNCAMRTQPSSGLELLHIQSMLDTASRNLLVGKHQYAYY